MIAYTVDEVAKMVGVNRSTLIYHHKYQGLVEPNRFGTRRLYTEEDVERIRSYFRTWTTRDKPHDRSKQKGKVKAR